MDYKSIEIIIKPLVLNKLPKYWNKIIKLATFGPLGMNPVRIPSWVRLGWGYFLRKNWKKILKTNSLGVDCWLTFSKSHGISSVARNSNTFFFGEGQILIEIFKSPMHNSRTEARNRNINFFSVWVESDWIFPSPMLHSSRYCSQKPKFIFLPIEIECRWSFYLISILWKLI